MAHQGGSSGWFIRVAHQGGSSGWLIRVAHQGGSSGWLIRVAHQGGSSGWLIRVVHQGGSSGWLIRVAHQGGSSEWLIRVAHQSGRGEGISVTAPWVFNWFSDENGNKVLIQIIALGVYLESISIDADMSIQGQYTYTIGSYSNCPFRGSIHIPSVHTVTIHSGAVYIYHRFIQ